MSELLKSFFFFFSPENFKLGVLCRHIHG